MRQKSEPVKESAEKVVKDIRRTTRRHFSAEDKIRIVNVTKPKILLTFGYAENAFNHNGRFDPGVKLLSMIASRLLVSSAG